MPRSDTRLGRDAERIFVEMARALGLPNVDPLAAVWSNWPTFVVVGWDDFAPNLSSRAFEDAADHVRAEAVNVADHLGGAGVRPSAGLSDDDAIAVRDVLDVFHYADPKLLVLVSAARLAVDGALDGTAAPHAHSFERIGHPEGRIPAIDVAPPREPRLSTVLDDAAATFDMAAAPTELRALGRWPQYLAAAWARIKRAAATPRFRRASDELRATARSVAHSLEHPVAMTRERIVRLGDDPDGIAAATERLERSLAAMVIAVATLMLDFRSADELLASPFALPPRAPA